MINKREAVTAIFWIFLGLIIATSSATFPFGEWKAPGPAFLPFALGIILALLGIILFLQAIKHQDLDRTAPAAAFLPEGAAFKRVALTLAAMLLSAALLNVLGFVITVFFLLFFLIRVIEPTKWSVAVFYALVSAAGSFVLFQVIFKTQLPRGLLGF